MSLKNDTRSEVWCYRRSITPQILCLSIVSCNTILVFNNVHTLILSVLSPTTHWHQSFQIVHEKYPSIDRPSFQSPVGTYAPANHMRACVRERKPTQDVDPMLIYCWPTVCGTDPTRTQHCVRSHVCWEEAGSRCFTLRDKNYEAFDHNFGLMLEKYRKQSPNISLTLIQPMQFAQVNASIILM